MNPKTENILSSLSLNELLVLISISDKPKFTQEIEDDIKEYNIYITVGIITRSTMLLREKRLIASERLKNQKTKTRSCLYFFPTKKGLKMMQDYLEFFKNFMYAKI